MLITLIAAMSEDGFIAQNGRIPWHLPEDIRNFREYCDGKTLLVGRRTFEEMNGWFHNHFPIVLTRRGNYPVPAGEAARSVEQAVQLAARRGVPELVVLGGGEVFAGTIGLADRMIITVVQTTLGEGTPFPVRDFSGWREESAQHFPADHLHAFSFNIRHFSKPNPTPPCNAEPSSTLPASSPPPL